MEALWRNSVALAGTAGIVTSAVAVALCAKLLWGGRREEVERRLERTISSPSREGQAAGLSPAAEPSLGAGLLRALSRLSRPSAAMEVLRIRQRLDHAGLRSERAVELFLGSKVALALIGGGGFLSWTALAVNPVGHALQVTTLLAALGFIVPNVWVSRRVAQRQKQLSRELPDTLDLLVTCVEAGLGLEAALSRVVEETRRSGPLLAGEMTQTGLEIQAGVARGEAFRRLAMRTGLDELRTLAATLVQTELFGTSIAKALRVQAAGMRQRRSYRAEEQAAMVATKMLVPLILCILPSLFTVIMGPAVVRIVRTLLPTLGGGV